MHKKLSNQIDYENYLINNILQIKNIFAIPALYNYTQNIIPDIVAVNISNDCMQTCCVYTGTVQDYYIDTKANTLLRFMFITKKEILFLASFDIQKQTPFNSLTFYVTKYIIIDNIKNIYYYL